MHFSFVFAVVAALTASAFVSACPTLCALTDDCCPGQTCKAIYLAGSVSMSSSHSVFLKAHRRCRIHFYSFVLVRDKSSRSGKSQQWVASLVTRWYSVVDARYSGSSLLVWPRCLLLDEFSAAWAMEALEERTLDIWSWFEHMICDRSTYDIGIVDLVVTCKLEHQTLRGLDKTHDINELAFHLPWICLLMIIMVIKTRLNLCQCFECVYQEIAALERLKTECYRYTRRGVRRRWNGEQWIREWLQVLLKDVCLSALKRWCMMKGFPTILHPKMACSTG